MMDFILFNGTKLTIKGTGYSQSYSAVSGQRINGNFEYSIERQKQRLSGPIPAGSFWIRPDELWTNAWYKRGSYASWGNYRITIHPRKGTETYGRGGFFIHGGNTPGSIGHYSSLLYEKHYSMDMRYCDPVGCHMG
jgi:hypothetical protein